MAHWDTSGLLKLFIDDEDGSTFKALAAAGVPYAGVGGNAVAAEH